MESVIFIILAIFAAAVLLYASYWNHRCRSCGQKLKSKKYLYFSPTDGHTTPVCEDCFFDAVVKTNPEENNAN